jgi:NADPH:quinone reductase-like Zn-dependent oxidoreductase
MHPFAKESLMVHAIHFAETGGPEVLIWQQVSVDKPGPGQVPLGHTAIGLNFIDAYIAAGAMLGAIVGSKRSAEHRRT